MPNKPNLFRGFLVVYVLLTAVRNVSPLRRKSHVQRTLKGLLSRGKDTEAFKEALFAVSLPRLYSFWSRRYPRSAIPVILSTPLIHLVEPSHRRTLVVYVATAAAVNFGRGTRQRQMLPPAWTLMLIANSWLLWAFLFQRKSFPRGYGGLILRHSGYGSGEPTEQLVQFLQRTGFETYPPGWLSTTQSTSSPEIHPEHTRAVCARLHPATPSCLKTYVKAWLTQFPQVFKWVGAFGALELLFRRRRKLREEFGGIFKDWFFSTVRGTAFVVGTINTCWGLTCLFQRILRPGTLPHLRWIANGLLGDLWVLALPPKRRTEFSLYCTRLAVVSCWDLLGEWNPKCGEAIVFALSWLSLLRDRRNGKGPRGIGSAVLDYMDGHTNRANKLS